MRTPYLRETSCLLYAQHCLCNCTESRNPHEHLSLQENTDHTLNTSSKNEMQAVVIGLMRLLCSSAREWLISRMEIWSVAVACYRGRSSNQMGFMHTAIRSSTPFKLRHSGIGPDLCMFVIFYLLSRVRL